MEYWPWGIGARRAGVYATAYRLWRRPKVIGTIVAGSSGRSRQQPFIGTAIGSFRSRRCGGARALWQAGAPPVEVLVGDGPSFQAVTHVAVAHRARRPGAGTNRRAAPAADAAGWAGG